MNRRLVNKIKDYLDSKPIEKAWIFGSFSRGEEKENSDIDILVEFTPNTRIGMLYFRMISDLESLCGRKIDLVENGMLHADVSASVEKDSILIYERGN